MTEPLWLIYGLRHADSPYLYRYIGLTTVGMSERFSGHLTSKTSTAKNLWMKKNAGKVVSEVIEVCPEGDIDYLRAREMFWIAYYRETYGRYDSGLPNRCLNLTDGGDGTVGWKAPEATRMRMSASGTGRKFSDTHKQRISQSLKGKNTWSKGNPQFLAGGKHTEEALVKMSEANRGEKNPMYGRGKVIVTCPYCPKSGGEAGMKVHHFNNCKKKPE